jgi:hypothetical protein
MNPPIQRWRWPTSVAVWMIGVTGMVAWGIGALDQFAGATASGEQLAAWGRPVGVVGLIVGFALKPRGSGTLRKLLAISVGLWPFLAFGLFLRWQINMSEEQRSACEAGDHRSCERLAIRREKRGRFEDAQPLFERACGGGIARACYNAGAMLRDGRGVERSTERAAALFRTGCDGDDALSCQLLGQLLKRGDGLPRDLVEARRLFDRACTAGLASACSELEFLE